MSQKNKNQIGFKHQPGNNVVVLTLKSMESFQDNSGMKGIYTKEYQHHYWTIVGRIHTGGQLLDIAFPLVMFNYPQIISGGDIKFKLTDVTKASNETLALAKEKFKEFKETLIYKQLTEEYGIIDWSYQSANTCHVHPGRMSTFSGIDLRKEYTYPGVVYPLSAGDKLSTFSGIICHIDGKAEMVRNEYRNFSGKIGEDKEYLHGRCITYVKSYTPEPLPAVKQPDPVLAGPIDNLFNIIPTQPRPIADPKQKDIKSFVLKDNLLGVQGDEISKALAIMWEQCDFEPDTSQVFKKNLTEAQTAIRTTVYSDPDDWYSRYAKEYSTHRNSNQKHDNGKGNNSKLTVIDQKNAIVKADLASWTELYNKSSKDLNKLYTKAMAVFREKKKETKKANYLVNGYYPLEVVKIRSLLEEEKYLSFAKMANMSDHNVTAYYDKFYVAE